MHENIEHPLVSVLMTSFNRSDFIAEAIESILASTYQNFELIIVDDVSTDDTYNIAKAYERKDERVKVFLNEANLGDYANRNQAASYASGKYLKYLDSDDTIYPEGLAYCVQQMELHPLSSFGIAMPDEKAESDAILMESESVVYNQFFVADHLLAGPSGSIIKRTFFEQINKFNPAFRMASDFHFNLKAASSSPVVLLKKRFFFYRIHEGQELNNPKGYMIYGFLARKSVFEDLPLPLKTVEVRYLKEQLYRNQALTVIKDFIKRRNPVFTSMVMKETGFGFTDIIKWALTKSMIKP